MTVAALPIYQLTDVVAALRQVAHRIEDGQVSANRVVLVIETDDGTVTYKAFGQDFTRAHAAGICFAAAQLIVKGAIEDDEESGK